MEINRFSTAIPKPCLSCNSAELKILKKACEDVDDDVWVYTVPVYNSCIRCSFAQKGEAGARFSVTRKVFPKLCHMICPVIEAVQVPLPAKIVGNIERTMHSASTAEKGSEFRTHSNFIHQLSLLDVPELQKQALCVWAPPAMMAYMRMGVGCIRKLKARPEVRASKKEESPTSSTVPSPAESPVFKGNPDVVDGEMVGSVVDEDQYGKEDRTRGGGAQSEPQVLAHQIGPDLIPTEVFQSTDENLKAGLAKRVKPLPFKAEKDLIRKIDKTVSKLIGTVFSEKKIAEWRMQNPYVSEMKSKKWTQKRWDEAEKKLIADLEANIEQEFQIKINEALPAKDKAPRPIIQCGDEAQVMMMLPVKCFEELLFAHFEQASIKHVDKVAAMARVQKHLRTNKPSKRSIIEGDGSAWDACCNHQIRSMTENRIVRHIIDVLGEDAEIPKNLMEKVFADMEKKKLRGKAKTKNANLKPMRVIIESIRQSGHRGTSCFNWLINFVLWLCIMTDEPWNMIEKVRKNGKTQLPDAYRSPRDSKLYSLKYAFEGDDSVLSTTEDVTKHEASIEHQWTMCGFRMKLVFVKEKMTFTGYDFLCDSHGPIQDAFIPEVSRNIASSSWTCSSLVKSFPHKKHEVGAAAFLARASQFGKAGAFARYFAQIGLAHCAVAGDQSLGEEDAMKLGISPVNSVLQELSRISESVEPMTGDIRKLCVSTFGGLTVEQEANLLTCECYDPVDTDWAKQLIPKSIWDPAKFSSPRRPPGL